MCFGVCRAGLLTLLECFGLNGDNSDKWKKGEKNGNDFTDPNLVILIRGKIRAAKCEQSEDTVFVRQISTCEDFGMKESAKYGD